MKAETFGEYPNNKQENWIAYRESAEFKEAVKRLEEFGVVAQAKCLILATALNLKKASAFEMLADSPKEMEKILSDLGLYFGRDKSVEEEYNQILQESGVKGKSYAFVIGTTPNAVNEALWRIEDILGDEEAFGKAMEFPDTAVSAWQRYRKSGNSEELLDQKSPKLTEEEKAFSFFRFSSDNWEKEVEWLEQIIAGVKLYSPKIYQQVIDQDKKTVYA